MSLPNFVLNAVQEEEMHALETRDDVAQAYRETSEVLIGLYVRMFFLTVVHRREFDRDRIEDINDEVRQLWHWLQLSTEEPWVPLTRRTRYGLWHLFGSRDPVIDFENRRISRVNIQAILDRLFRRTSWGQQIQSRTDLMAALTLLGHVFTARELQGDFQEQPDWLLDLPWVAEAAMWPGSAIHSARHTLVINGLLSPASQLAAINLREAVVAQVLDTALENLEEDPVIPADFDVAAEWGEPRWIASQQAYRGYLEEVMRAFSMDGLAQALSLPWFSDDYSEIDEAIEVINVVIEGAGIPYFVGLEDGELFVLDPDAEEEDE